jgi:hypothetical protein
MLGEGWLKPEEVLLTWEAVLNAGYALRPGEA